MEQNRKMMAEEIDRLLYSPKPGDLHFTYKGVLYPTVLCCPETFQKLEGFEAREDDVVMVAYPKCGMNWLTFILNEIVFLSAKKPQSPDIPVIEFGTPEKLERINKQPSPRVLTTHLHHDNIPSSFFKNKVKKLVLFRNPKDAAVSYFHFHNNNPKLPSFSSWDEFFQQFISGKVFYGCYFKYMLAWNNYVDDDDVLIVTYEDMKKNLVAGVKQIAEFFGLPLTQEQIQEIADKSTFQNMKANYQETHGQFGQFLFRKGDVGDWKNHFSPAQSREIDAKFKECLGGTNLEAKLKYDVYCKT
ncbi:sulfotransferase 6B1 [Microcaecilia unicolor]|uniref:Sulfotransferase n=1 Tax=Microcaecilia unicolor TaxID=1415580 RepID=A0A6P7XPG9_9AMPH|nr:sulfotransferase 6B1-like [Microcaecilia unicolor]